jgi:biotin carboxyl carrier protein
MEDLILNINNKEFKAKFDNDVHSKISIDDKQYKIDLLKEYSAGIYSFSVNQKLAQVEFDLNEEGNIIVSYEGLTYDVGVTNETKKLLQQYIKQSGSTAASSAGNIKSPMPGMVVKILVKEGLPVNKGEKLIIIEAMKMENALTSPLTGTVKSIKVKEGEAVEKDALLIELDMGMEI